MVTQDSLDLASLIDDDLLNMIDSSSQVLSFEEIDEIALTDAFPEYDNAKLMDDHGLNVGLPVPPCAVMVQPASPDSTQTLGPVSPEMIVMQPVSPGLSVESALSPYSSEPFTSDSDSLQSTTPEPFSMEPASPAQHCVVTCSPQPASLDPVELQVDSLFSLEFIASPVSLQVKEEIDDHLQLDDEGAEAPKKRGRKRKYPEGTAPPRRARAKKTKVYELGPLADEKEEKKRRNAINAKRHRDMQKGERDRLAQELQAVTAERDNLLKLVERLQQSEAQLQLRLANKERQNVLL